MVRKNSVRPSLWVLTVCVGLLCASVLYAFVGSGGGLEDRSSTAAEPSREDDRSSRSRQAPRDDSGYPDSNSSRSTRQSFTPVQGGYYVGNDLDPQMRAARRSFAHLDDPQTFLSYHAVGEVTMLDGHADVMLGDTCSVRVLPLGRAAHGGRGETLNCLIRVQCDQTVLYPDAHQQAGYVACHSESNLPDRAADTRHTDDDGDPTVEFDRGRREVVVTDEREDGSGFAIVVQLHS